MNVRRARRWLPRLRKPDGNAEWAAAAVLGAVTIVAASQAAHAAADAVARAWPALLTLLAVAGAWGVTVWSRRRTATQARAARLAQLRIPLARIDTMNDRDFELAARDLLIRDGVPARHVGRRGDQAADVIAEHPTRSRIVIQCKHTTVGGKVGSHTMYEVKGTAETVHGARIAVVVTNGTFTRDARQWGDTYGVHWVDRDRLQQWAEHGAALDEVLRLPPPRARRTPRGRAA